MANEGAFENLLSEEFDNYEEIHVDFDELERTLQDEIDNDLLSIEILDEEREIIGNADKLGESVKNVIWEQFLNQVATTAGEEFVTDNNGMRLDLRKEVHIQTTENFAAGKIATHNTEINYQKRYDDWQAKFEKDSNGNILTHQTRTGKEEANLVKGAREVFDKDRPKGSVLKHTDMDHTVSAAEIIRDPSANAHLEVEDQVKFANSDKNLYEMDSSWNRSKGDKSTTEWLDNPNANGQKPDEIFDISPEKEQEMRLKDKEARDEYERVKKEGEKRSIEEGKKSQKKEALKIGKHAVKAVLFQLLFSLSKEMVNSFVKWIKSKDKSPKTLLRSFGEAIVSFVKKIKEHIINAVDVVITVIAEAIFGPIVRIIKRVWMLLKQGFRSFKESFKYLMDPANKGKSSAIKMMEIGKIITAGVTVAGALGLTQLIEMGLTALGTQVPALIIEIPIIGSLASIIAIFLGGLLSGIIGAMLMLAIDKAIEGKRKENIDNQIIDKGNNIIQKQKELFAVKEQQMESVRDEQMKGIVIRHLDAEEQLEDLYSQVNQDNGIEDVNFEQIGNSLDEVWKRLSQM